MDSLFVIFEPTSLLLGGVVVLCVLWWLSTRRPPGLPPGPGLALPLLGHLHLLAKDPRPQFSAWRRQYGDVFSLYLGGRLVVVLAGYSATREAFITFADVFSDRPDIFIMKDVFRTTGVIASSGHTWKEQRKTATEILRAMGMGKNVLADRIQEEITHFIKAIKDHQGAPVDLASLTQVSISNNICSIIMGTRFDYQDTEFINYLQSVDAFLKHTAGAAILNYMPMLEYLPGDLFGKKKVLASIEAVYGFMAKHVADHRKTLEEKGHVDHSDFIFSYLQQIQDQKSRGVENTTLSEESLQSTMNDLFAAGTETTSTAIRWALLFFLHHPHVQDKCFQEISDVIGPHRPPSMSDKAKLTYLEATVCEVLRKGNVAPINFHGTAKDVRFRGYFIPKGTTVLQDMNSVLENPDIWGDPENFRPERFIGPDGKLTKPDELTPFSMGRRVCLGESMARMELFLYLATLIQHFHFLPPEEGQLPSLEGVFGAANTPHPYRIRAVPRM